MLSQASLQLQHLLQPHVLHVCSVLQSSFNFMLIMSPFVHSLGDSQVVVLRNKNAWALL